MVLSGQQWIWGYIPTGRLLPRTVAQYSWQNAKGWCLDPAMQSTTKGHLRGAEEKGHIPKEKPTSDLLKWAEGIQEIRLPEIETQGWSKLFIQEAQLQCLQTGRWWKQAQTSTHGFGLNKHHPGGLLLGNINYWRESCQRQPWVPSWSNLLFKLPVLPVWTWGISTENQDTVSLE